jgi:hypothetical protein
MDHLDPWLIGVIGYGTVATLTLIPTVWAYFIWKPLNPGGPSFDDSPHFSAAGKLLLNQNFQRIAGTLFFWKNRARVYNRFHYYCIFWTLMSSWAVPLISSVAPAESQAKWLVTAVSAHVALALSFYRGLSIAENLKAFRHGESEFYDLFRRMLDRPHAFGKTEAEQIEAYAKEVEVVRRLVRNAETGNFITPEDIRGSSPKPPGGGTT